MNKYIQICLGLIIGIILLFNNITLSSMISAKENFNINNKTSSPLPIYIFHSPIYINGNHALTRWNGIRGGSGTKDNPYIISSWRINGSIRDRLENLLSKYKLLEFIYNLFFKHTYAIVIANTDKYIVIRNNYLFNWKEEDSPIGTGIYIENTKNIIIENNMINSCNRGIHFLYKNENIVIRNNSLKNIDSYTIIGNNALIENNSIDSCDIAIKSSNSIIQYNLVKSSSIGIATTGPCYISHNNLIANSVGIGCYWPSHSCTILDNIIQNNNWGVYLIEDCHPEIHNNNIYENNAGVIYLGGGPTNATLNWWGSYDGPSGAGQGNGDSISENVYYIPWLTNPNPNAGI